MRRIRATAAGAVKSQLVSTPAERQSPRQRARRRADIQGLRALAVGAVVVNHTHLRLAPGGFVGVDIFFVISGFLITGQLLRSLEQQGRVGFLGFYVRRARRILPAALVVVVATVVAAWLFVPPLQLRQVLDGAPSTVLYVPNYLFASQGTDYMLQTTTSSLFLHYWSLGVEEQFYIVWPALLTVVFLAGRRSVKMLAATMAVLAGASLVACVVTTNVNQPWAFFSLPTRAWEFAVGGLLAIAVAHIRFRRPLALASLAGWLGLTALGAVMLGYSDRTLFPGLAALVPVVAAALVILGNTWGTSAAPSRLLGLAPMVFLGEISYSIYLVHWPLLMIPQAALTAGGSSLSAPAVLVLGAMSIPVAYVLYRTIERPFRDSAWAIGLPPRPVLLAALCTSIVLAGIGAGVGHWLKRQPMSTEITASAFVLRTDPQGTSYVPANMTPTLSSIADERSHEKPSCENLDRRSHVYRCDFGDNLAAPLVVFFGDSHADEFRFSLLGLADRGQIRLETFMMSGCPAAAVTARYDGQPYAACDSWRSAAIKELVERHPAVVLLGSFLADHDPRDESAWRKGYGQTIDALAPYTNVGLMVDTPTPSFDVPTCVSAHLHDTGACAVTIDPGFRGLEHSIASAHRVPAIDVDSYLCRGTTCPAVLGDVLAYSDGSHISPELSGRLAPRIVPYVENLLQAGATTTDHGVG